MSIVSFARRTKYISLLLLVSMVNFACAPISNIFGSRGRTYQYIYEMTEPVAAKDMMYRATDFNLGFQIDQGAVNFNIRNRSASNISLMGGIATLGINGKFTPVRTSISYYHDTVSSPISNIIPVRSTAEDFFIPRNNITYTNGKWVEKTFFVTRDNNNPAIRQVIQKNIGSEIGLVLPIKVGTQVSEYTFKFKVTGVKVLNPDSLPSSNPRLPPPAKPMLPATNKELWWAGGIVGTILLVTIIVMTSSKKFPNNL